MDAYKVLDIPVTASKEEIRAAYRRLALRWHPDRFMEGPERDWANEKMAKINAAYRACLDHAREIRGETAPVDDQFAAVRQLIDVGQYASARRMLMSCTTRCAEWNYLFGVVLAAMRETDKAIIYLTVAVHQDPTSSIYARALREARAKQNSSLTRLQNLFARAR